MKRCPICGGEASLAFRGTWTIGQVAAHEPDFQRCSTCHFSLTDYLNGWSAERMTELYSGPYWNDQNARARERLPLEKVRLVRGWGGANGIRRVLDMGSGEGWGVEVLRKAGYDAYGFDLVPPRTCQDFIVCGDRAAVQGPFDAVTAVEVMEHLPDPVDVCRWVSGLIRPGGYFVFSTSVYDPRTHGPDWWYLDHVGHVSLYSGGALRILAEKTGFQRVGRMFSTHVWMRPGGGAQPWAAPLRIKLRHLVNKCMAGRAAWHAAWVRLHK